MDYWRGAMDWPTDKDWKCEVCGEGAWYLIWGFIHARCRCEKCHTQYQMRDKDQKLVTRPILMLKPEYIEAAKAWWETKQRPISMASKEYWEQYRTE